MRFAIFDPQPLAWTRSPRRNGIVPVIIERAIAIIREIPLKSSIATVLTRQSKTAARIGNTVTPANLQQQVRCDLFRPIHIQRNHSIRASLQRCLIFFDSIASVSSVNNLLGKSIGVIPPEKAHYRRLLERRLLCCCDQNLFVRRFMPCDYETNITR